jgi:predicted hydrocarbon binding protein
MSKTHFSAHEEQQYPKYVANSFFLPSKNLFQIVALSQKNDKAIPNILQYLDPLVSILRIEVDRSPTTDAFQLVMYVEAKLSTTAKAEIERAIFSSPFTISSKVQESHNGLLLDTIQFPIMMTTGYRAFVFSQDVFNRIFSSIREKFSSGGDVIIYNEGLAYGEQQAKIMYSFFGKQKVFELLPELVKLYQSVGLGRPVLSKFELQNPSSWIRIYDSLECQGQKSSVPYSQFLRGNICGMANVLYDRAMKCKETKCVAMGNEYCEFELAPA